MRHVGIRAVLTLVTVVGLLGCAAGRSSEQLGRTGLLIEAPDARDVGYIVNWAEDLRIPRRDELAFVEVLGDTIIVVQQPSNLVSAISVREGRVVWRRIIGGERERLYAPARHGDVVLINSDARLFHLRVNTGEVLQIQPLDETVLLGPVVVADENAAVFGSTRGNLFAHDLNAGFPQWRYGLTDRILIPPTAIGNHIFAGDARGEYVMLNVAEGYASWRGRTFGALGARPAADSGNVYVPSRDGTLYALNRATGRDQWVYRSGTPLTHSPYVADQIVVLPVPGAGVVGLDTASGDVAWRLETSLVPVAQRDNRLVFAGDNVLRLVNPQTGQIVASAETLPLRAVRPGPDNSLILVGPTGRLLRMNAAR